MINAHPHNGSQGKKSLKVAVVVPYFAPKIGGVENYAAQIARGFNSREGWEAVVFTSNDQGCETSSEVVDGLKIFRFPRWAKLSNTPMSPLWPWQLRRAMVENGIDLVNVHMPVPFMAEAAALACGRRPLVVTYHAGSMAKNRRFADLGIRFYEGRLLPLILRRANAVVAVSPTAEAMLLRHAAGKTFRISPGVDDTVFAAEEPTGPDPETPTVLYVGRIERSSAWKGIDYLLKAFSLVLEQIPEAKLVLVGGGDAVRDHKGTVARLGIGDRVRFRGALTGGALVDAYREASLVVLPSTTESESFGMTLLEAMACRKPVVASNVGGIPFVVDDGVDGVLVPPGDAPALATACAGVLRSAEEAAAMGDSGHRKVKDRYTWPERIDRYDEVFMSATKSSQRPIVQVVPYFRPHIGGMEVVVQTIADGMSQSRPVEVLTSKSNPGPAVERSGSLRVRRLFTLEIAHVPLMPTLLIHLLRLPRRAAIHVHIAQAFVPEMVWLYSMITRRPYVAHFHLDVDPSGRLGRIFVAYKRALLGRVLRSAARVIAVSPDQPDFLADAYGVPRDRIVLIPNGVGSQFFQECRDAPAPDRPFRLLFVGRLAPQKNVSLLLRAVAEVRQSVELLIVGDGEERPILERLCAELGMDNVRLVGAKMGEELVSCYRWADAFVLTSVKESTGLVLLEAMAARLPIVATRVAGVTDTVADAGLLTPPDASALAGTLDRLVSDPALWTELSERSAKRAERHPWAVTLRALDRIYSEVFP